MKKRYVLRADFMKKRYVLRVDLMKTRYVLRTELMKKRYVLRAEQSRTKNDKALSAMIRLRILIINEIVAGS